MAEKCSTGSKVLIADENTACFGLFPLRGEPHLVAPGCLSMKRLTMSDINAYLDGALSDEEKREVELVIKTDIEAAALLQQYRQHVQELHRIYDGVLNEPVPERMLDLLRRRKTEGA
jgi:hypothetical protein